MTLTRPPRLPYAVVYTCRDGACGWSGTKPKRVGLDTTMCPRCGRMIGGPQG